MGTFLTVSTHQIKPSQPFLKEETVKHILGHLKLGETGNLPPTPIVRVIPGTDYYVAIDGHNLIAVHDYMGKEIEVYVADSPTDGLVTDPNNYIEAIEMRNQDLLNKFDSSLNQHRQLKSEGINSFEDLRSRHQDIF